jgi:DNA-binding LytR/AlgR family response regulator
MQDHYVEVHTAAGSELLLLRFRDALREVEDVDGLQVHRSHWVARNAVVGVERRGGGRIVLRLVNGSRVPVSRSFAPVLKAQGWL